MYDMVWPLYIYCPNYVQCYYPDPIAGSSFDLNLLYVHGEPGKCDRVLVDVG